MRAAGPWITVKPEVSFWKSDTYDALSHEALSMPIEKKSFHQVVFSRATNDTEKGTRRSS